MIVIPLVVTIIFASVARLGDIKTLGKIGGRTLGFYWLTLIPAIALGMGVMALGLRFVPEITMPASDAVSVPRLRGLTDFFIGLVPPNIFEAAAKGAILPLIVFTSLFAAAAGTLERERRERMVQAADDISAALMKPFGRVHVSSRQRALPRRSDCFPRTYIWRAFGDRRNWRRVLCDLSRIAHGCARSVLWRHHDGPSLGDNRRARRRAGATARR